MSKIEVNRNSDSPHDPLTGWTCPLELKAAPVDATSGRFPMVERWIEGKGFVMVQAARYPWQEIRAAWEAGTSEAKLSRLHGCSRRAISDRRNREDWRRPATQENSRVSPR